MQEKKKQDGWVGFVIGGVLTVLASVFILQPLGASWWVYLLTFLILSGISIEALEHNRAQARVAYDPLITARPATGDGRFCTKCGQAVQAGAVFCAKCGAKLT